MARLSFWAKARLLLVIATYVVPSTVIRVPGVVLRAWLKRVSIIASIRHVFIRTLAPKIAPHEIQASLPPTRTTYNSWMKKKGYIPFVEELDDGVSRALWLGPKTRNKVVLFLHGGGYLMPMDRGHMDWMAYVKEEAAKAGVDISVCILEYCSLSLTKPLHYHKPSNILSVLIPDYPYPHQMIGAISILKYLVAAGYEPGNIIVGGDSAGGHLSLSLLSHLQHPRPSDPGTNLDVNLKSPLRGCFLVSPLVSYNFATPSYKRWFNTDVLSERIVREWGRHLTNNSPYHQDIAAGKGWAMALDVPEKWWEGLNVVDHILVTGGEEEVFRDHIVQFIEVLKRSVTKVKLTAHMATEAHDGPLLDFMAKRPPDESAQLITAWIIARFKEDGKGGFDVGPDKAGPARQMKM